VSRTPLEDLDAHRNRDPCGFAGARGKVASHRALDEGRRFEIDEGCQAASSASAA
jgi:hypothetical protein